MIQHNQQSTTNNQCHTARASAIMAAEAHRLQKLIVWGTGTSKTVEVEIDATVICKWKAEEEGHLVHYYYCYIGARQRGNLATFALMPLGVSKSIGEGRVNPESSEAYHAFCKEVFGDQKHNLISMTDGAQTYRCRCELCTLRFEEHYWVNHSLKPIGEFTRQEPAILADVESGETRAGTAGTQGVDADWGLLKSPLPKNISARTPAEIERCDLLVRAQQFRRMISTGDRWAAFLEGARYWIRARAEATDVCKARAGNFARSFGQQRRSRQAQLDLREQQAEVPLSVGEAAALQNLLVAGDLDEAEQLSAADDQSAREFLSTAEQAFADEHGDGDEHSSQEKSRQAYADRYWEPQKAGHCGMHALNHLVGSPQFLPTNLIAACADVLAELRTGDASDHVLPGGWYSHSVLAHVLQNTNPPMWKLASNRASVADWQLLQADEGVLGALTNINNSHWTATVRHAGVIFYCDSKFLPVLIDVKDWEDILHKRPDTYLVTKHDRDLL
jgi:hypothetical protein